MALWRTQVRKSHFQLKRPRWGRFKIPPISTLYQSEILLFNTFSPGYHSNRVGKEWKMSKKLVNNLNLSRPISTNMVWIGSVFMPIWSNSWTYHFSFHRLKIGGVVLRLHKLFDFPPIFWMGAWGLCEPFWKYIQWGTYHWKLDASSSLRFEVIAINAKKSYTVRCFFHFRHHWDLLNYKRYRVG